MKQTRLIPLLGLGLTLFLSQPHLIYGNSGYGGGSGTESDPYLISTPEHLNQLQLDVNVNGVDTTGKYYQLTNNIDLSGYDNDSDETNGNWTPIGKSRSVSFKGILDGNGYKILNLEIVLPNQDYVGLFGFTNYANVQNIGLETVNIQGNNYVGGLIGKNNAGLISQNYTTGSVSGNYGVGGLIGYQDEGTVDLSYSTANISGDTGVGGLVGSEAEDGSHIKRSFATGNVTGNVRVGGLVGHYAMGTISQSYSTGKVSGTTLVGGFAGALHAVTVTDSYWDIESSEQNSSAGRGEMGLTTSQMTGKNAETHLSGFDFNTIWKTTSGYPKFQWEFKEVELTNKKDLIINGNIQTLIADVTIPSVSPDLVIDPNSPDGAISPEFSIENQSTSPIRLELKTFEQTTNTFNDVLPGHYDSWEGLNKTQSQDLALGLVAKEGEGWQRLTTPTSYVANHSEHEIGVIKPTSNVLFEFDVHHGRAFSESKTVQYKMVFVFDLLS